MPWQLEPLVAGRRAELLDLPSGSALRKAELLQSVLAALAVARAALRWSYVFCFHMCAA